MRLLKLTSLFLVILLLCSCGIAVPETVDIAATTGPVAQFAREITDGTGLIVVQVISDSVSCLHDYSLSVRQMEALEKSNLVLISGAGLEAFMEDALRAVRDVVDCSAGVELKDMEGHDHHHGHEEAHGHHHEDDPHIWLDPLRAKQMAENICKALTVRYPEHEAEFRRNMDQLAENLEALHSYGLDTLKNLQCRELITFHDGFGYLADTFDLQIVAAIEEESGSEASARDLIEMIHLVEEHDLPAVFTEVNGSVSAASVIQAEIGTDVYTLDMAMGGSDYLQAMRANIDTLKEALQ